MSNVLYLTRKRCFRLLTDNLLGLPLDEIGKTRIQYSVDTTRKQSMGEEILEDANRMAYAIASGDYSHLLELELVRAEMAGADEKGLVKWTVLTPASTVQMRVSHEAGAQQWVDAVNGVSPATKHRQSMMRPEEVEASVMKAETNRILNEQICQDMGAFLKTDATLSLSAWAAQSEWAADTGGEKDSAGSPTRAQGGIWAQLWSSVGGACDEHTTESVHDDGEHAPVKSLELQLVAAGSNQNNLAKPAAVSGDLPGHIVTALSAVATVRAEAPGVAFQAAIHCLKAAMASDTEGKEEEGVGPSAKVLEAVLLYACSAEHLEMSSQSPELPQKVKDSLANKAVDVDKRLASLRPLVGGELMDLAWLELGEGRGCGAEELRRVGCPLTAAVAEAEAPGVPVQASLPVPVSAAEAATDAELLGATPPATVSGDLPGHIVTALSAVATVRAEAPGVAFQAAIHCLKAAMASDTEGKEEEGVGPSAKVLEAVLLYACSAEHLEMSSQSPELPQKVKDSLANKAVDVDKRLASLRPLVGGELMDLAWLELGEGRGCGAEELRRVGCPLTAAVAEAEAPTTVPSTVVSQEEKERSRLEREATRLAEEKAMLRAENEKLQIERARLLKLEQAATARQEAAVQASKTASAIRIQVRASA